MLDVVVGDRRIGQVKIRDRMGCEKREENVSKVRRKKVVPDRGKKKKGEKVKGKKVKNVGMTA